MTLEQYLILKNNLATAQAAELAARLEMVKMSGFTKKGSKTITFDSGAKVQVVNTVNKTVDESQLEHVKEQLANDQLYYQVFVPKPTLSESAFKLLTKEQQEICEEAIISKDGTPQFKVLKLAGGVEPIVPS